METFPENFFDEKPVPNSVTPLEDVIEEEARKAEHPSMTGSQAPSSSPRPKNLECSAPAKLARSIKRSLKHGCGSSRNYAAVAPRKSRNNNPAKKPSNPASLKGKRQAAPSKDRRKQTRTQATSRRYSRQQDISSDSSEASRSSGSSDDEEWSQSDSRVDSWSEQEEETDGSGREAGGMVRRRKQSGRTLRRTRRSSVHLCSRCRKTYHKKRTSTG